MLFVGSDNGTVYALSQASGAVQWHIKLAGAVMGSPSVDPTKGEVVVGDSSGAITALSMTSGATLWSVATGGPVTATPTILTGHVYVGSQSGIVYDLNETTGAQAWTYNTGSSVTSAGAYWTFGSRKAYAVGTSNGHVLFLDPSNGTVVRNLSHGGGAVTGVTAAEGWVMVTFSNGAVYAVKFSHDIAWSYQSTRSVSPATLLNGVTYVASQDGSLRAFAVPGTQIP
jgi:outer membrane protein assembly factor BamB